MQDVELAIVLGGDGTILRAAELVRDGSAPILGINMGHVGFLAEIERDDMDDAVRRVIARDFQVEERMALQVRVKDAADSVVFETWALNEATVEKASRERMLEVVIEVDERPLSTFGCDGVVVSTPTGSTAYNLSAGGPVIHPAMDAIVLTPIAPHTLTHRPIVIPASREIRIRPSSGNAGAEIYVTFDGQHGFPVHEGDDVSVTRAAKPIRLVRAASRNYFEVLRKKLKWGER